VFSAHFVAAKPQNFRAHLSGASEAPANDSRAQGEAIFQLNADGSAVTFKVNVANIENVRASHIHLAPVGVNGPIVIGLYLGPTIPGRFQGTLAEGSFTATDLSGPLAGQTLADLMARLEAGELYVNVHTDQIPSGEIRGQLK
jgi:hypothetical protein